jgi:hypothetical protein
MKWAKLLTMGVPLTLSALGQSDIPTFKASARSAIVWDNDSPANASSTVIWDPLTGRELHRLSSGGVEITSLVGYERVSLSKEGTLLTYTTTITNNTASELSVQYGGASADGHTAIPLWVAPTSKGLGKSDRKKVWELSKMYCFKTGFSSNDNFFSAHTLSKILTVHPRTTLTVSSVTLDPRHSSLLCSMDGCHITGTIRYYITVNHRDYVFVWPGRSVVYCGE